MNFYFVNLITGVLWTFYHPFVCYSTHIHHMRIWLSGSCDVFSDLIGAKGKDVLYIGDHIFGDILKSKKIRGWRTFLVIPELTQELHVWTGKKMLYNRLQNLGAILSNVYRNLDSTSPQSPDISGVQEAIRVRNLFVLSTATINTNERVMSRECNP